MTHERKKRNKKKVTKYIRRANDGAMDDGAMGRTLAGGSLKSEGDRKSTTPPRRYHQTQHQNLPQTHPAMVRPEARALLSGNHAMSVCMGGV